jgi:hypothetical protein
MRGLRLGLLLLVVLLAPVTTRSLAAQSSLSMATGCTAANTAANRQQGDQWVQKQLKAFLPATTPTAAEALRMKSLELEAEQVKLALFSIGATCEQYLAGKMEKDDADRSLSGYEQTYADFIHDLGNDAIVLSARGQVSDLSALRSILTTIGTASRQAAVLGEEKLALQSWQAMVKVLVEWSSAFVKESCWDQAFSDDLPFAINQQHEILGTGIDVRPCAQRRFTASVENFTFESCTIRGVGDWRVSWNFGLVGSGGTGSGKLEYDRERARGNYSADWGANGVEYRASGEMMLARHDAAAGRQASYTLSGDMDVRIIKGKDLIAMMEKLMGQKTKPRQGPFSVTPTVSEKPCQSL